MKSFLLFISMLTLNVQVMASTSAGVTYSGRLLASTGLPVEGVVQFRLQIRTPNSANCLLFEETKTLDLTGKNGYFTLTLNDNTTGVILAGSYPLDRVFANNGKFEITHPNLSCGTGNEYIPNATDGRKLKAFFRDSTMAVNDWEELPAMDINFVPTALESVQVGGFKASHLLRVQDSSGVPQNITAFSPTEFANLLDLMDGTSASYLRSSTTTGIPAPVVSGNPSGAAAGSVWFDSVTGKLKYHDGSAVQTLGTSGGSVSSVAAGTGLTTGGTPITGAGTIAIADGGVDTLQIKDGAVTAAKLANSGVTANTYGSSVKIPVITVDAKGRLTLVTEADVTGLPSGNNGEYLKYTGGAWTSARVEISDVKSSLGANPSFFNFSAACTLEKTLTYDAINDRMNCTSIGINANQVTAGTLDKARLPVEALLDGGNSVTAPLAVGTTTNQSLRFLVNNTPQVVLDTSGNVGIGTNAPVGLLDLQTVGSSTDLFIRSYRDGGNHAKLHGLGNRGSAVSPQLLQDGDLALELLGRTYDTTGTTRNSLGKISIGADGAHTNSSTPGFIDFSLTPPGATSESSVARILSSGRMGLGTGSPTATLHIKAGGTAAGTSPLKFNSGGLLSTVENGAMEYDGADLYFTSGGTRRKLASTSGTGDYSGVGSIVGSGSLNVSAGGTNQNLILSGSGTGQVQSSSVLHVTNSTASTSTSTGALVVDGGLGVSGTVNAGSIAATTSILSPVIYGSAAPSGTLTLQGTSNTPRGYVMINPDGGNVGIGTTTPSAALDVNGTAKAQQFEVHFSAPSFILKDTDGTGSSASGDIRGLSMNGAIRWMLGDYQGNLKVENRTTGGSLQFKTENTERMTVLSDGNVGIGTATPVSPLHISGTAAGVTVDRYDQTGPNLAANLALGRSRGTAAAPAIVQATDVLGTLRFRGYTRDSANAADAWTILSTIDSQVETLDASNRASTNITFTTSTNSSRGEKMRITSDGKVGIGTINPTASLDISQPVALASGVPALQILDESAPTAFIRLTDGTSVASSFVPSLWAKAAGTNRPGLLLIGEPSTDINTAASAGVQINARLDSAALTATPLLTVYNYLDEKFRISAGGSVGIGSNDPTAMLHIKNFTGDPTLKLEGGGSTNPRLDLFETGDSGFSWLYDATANNVALVSRTVGVDAAPSIAAQRGSGNVTIGSIAGSTSKLDVQAADAGSGFSGGSAVPATTIRAMSTDAVAAGVGGSLGLGGAYNGASQSIFAAVRGYKANSTPGDAGGKIQLQTYHNGTGWNVGIYMDQDGDVGIGNTSPSERMEVTGNLKVTSAATCVLGTAAGGVNCTSDARLKDNVKIIPDALAKVLQLRGVEFDWNQKASGYGRHDIGVIAQEVEKVFPTLIYQDKSSGYKMVDYAGLVSPLIESTKELYGLCKASEAHIQSLERKVASLEEATVRLESENKELKERLEMIEKKLGIK